jgi:alkanesulfonate monooxygenase
VSERRIRLGAFLGANAATGAHAASWRHPDARADAGINFAHFVEVSRTAERGKFDLVFIADNMNVHEAPPAVLSRSAQYIANFEPLTLIAALTASTERIGLVATASTSWNEPHTVARTFATLERISRARTGWNIVTSTANAEARNFGRPGVVDRPERYARAREFTNAVRALWDGAVDPVLVQAGASDDGRAFASEVAEVVFTNHPTLELAQAYYADVKARAARLGRSPESILILPGISPFVGRTEDEARGQYDALQSLVDPIVGLGMLTMLLGADLSAYPLDGPLPDLLPPRTGSQSSFDNWTSLARRENLTIRELVARTVAARGKSVIVGTPVQVADHMQLWFENGAADGFNLMPPVIPGAFDDFVDLVIPELQERGLYRTEYGGETLRDHLGLARLPDLHRQDRHVVAGAVRQDEVV